MNFIYFKLLKCIYFQIYEDNQDSMDDLYYKVNILS